MRKIELNVGVPSWDSLVNFYNETNELTGKKKYRHIEKKRAIEILQTAYKLSRVEENKITALNAISDLSQN